MSCGQSRLSDIHAHAAPGAGDEPNFAHVSVSTNRFMNYRDVSKPPQLNPTRSGL
jgi:hypothetical protein